MHVNVFGIDLDLVRLGIGMLLLWFPRQWLRFGAFRPNRARRQKNWAPNRDRQPGDVSVWIGEEMAKMRNWVDLARSFVGGVAICGLAPYLGNGAINPAEGASLGRLGPWIILGMKTFILLVGLLIQVIRREERVILFAPLFYAQGISFGLLGWWPALLAIPGVWATNAVLPSAGIFLFVFGTYELILGFVFHANKKQTALAAGLSMLPMLISLLSKRRLAQFTKKTKVIDSSSSGRRSV